MLVGEGGGVLGRCCSWHLGTLATSDHDSNECDELEVLHVNSDPPPHPGVGYLDYSKTWMQCNVL